MKVIGWFIYPEMAKHFHLKWHAYLHSQDLNNPKSRHIAFLLNSIEHHFFKKGLYIFVVIAKTLINFQLIIEKTVCGISTVAKNKTAKVKGLIIILRCKIG